MTLWRIVRAGGPALVALLLATPAGAQDRRVVTEPQLPAAACATLAPAAGNRAAALQQALDRCAGRAVRLAAGRHDSGPIELPAHTTLWLDRGATLAAIPDPRLFDTMGHACGTIDARGKGCRPLIHLADATGAGIVGDGTIEGNGGQPMAGGAETWWQLARRAQREGGAQNVPRLIVADRGAGFTLYRVRLTNSPNFHVVANHLQGFTAWGIVIDTPADARNTDGIDPGASEDVTIAHVFIRTGDDNVAIKAGKAGGTRYVSVLDSHFYAGHGMSIGSETNGGVARVLVRNLTLDGTTSGLRIKSDISRGGLVNDVHYEDVCIRGSQRPIDIDTAYDRQARGTLIPVYRGIVLRRVHGDTGRLIVRGYDPAHALDLYLDDVRFAASATWQIANAHVHVGKDGAWPDPLAPDAPAPAPAPREDRCTAAFPPFPAVDGVGGPAASGQAALTGDRRSANAVAARP